MTKSIASYGTTSIRDNTQILVGMIACWAVIGIVISRLPSEMNGGVQFVALVALGSLGFAPPFFIVRAQRKRVGTRAKALLESRGFAVQLTPTVQERRAVLHQLSALAFLRTVDNDVDWIARRMENERELIVLRHSYSAPGGRRAFERKCTVVALAIRDTRPGVWLTRTNTYTRQHEAALGHTQDVQLGDAWFDENFRIQTLDEPAVARILTPRVKEFIATGPVHESWTVGYGYVVCVFGADTNSDGLEAMLARTRALRDVLESEHKFHGN